MTTTTLRTCDKCDAVVPADEPLYTLAIVAKINAVGNLPFSSQFSVRAANTRENVFSQNYFKDFCRTCMDKFGIMLVDTDKEKAKEKPKVTIEDLLQEIVDDAVEDRYNEGPP